jgi:hypothetical protein
MQTISVVVNGPFAGGTVPGASTFSGGVTGSVRIPGSSLLRFVGPLSGNDGWKTELPGQSVTHGAVTFNYEQLQQYYNQNGVLTKSPVMLHGIEINAVDADSGNDGSNIYCEEYMRVIADGVAGGNLVDENGASMSWSPWGWDMHLDLRGAKPKFISGTFSAGRGALILSERNLNQVISLGSGNGKYDGTGYTDRAYAQFGSGIASQSSNSFFDITSFNLMVGKAYFSIHQNNTIRNTDLFQVFTSNGSGSYTKKVYVDSAGVLCATSAVIGGAVTFGGALSIVGTGTLTGITSEFTTSVASPTHIIKGPEFPTPAAIIAAPASGAGNITTDDVYIWKVAYIKDADNSIVLLSPESEGAEYGSTPNVDQKAALTLPADKAGYTKKLYRAQLSTDATFRFVATVTGTSYTDNIANATVLAAAAAPAENIPRTSQQIGAAKYGTGNTEIPAGTYLVGDILFHNNATAGQYAGRICTAPGTESSSTWKRFGAIEA